MATVVASRARARPGPFYQKAETARHISKYGLAPKASLSFVVKNGGFMKRFLLGCIVLLSAAAMAQQTKSPVSDALRTMLAGREKTMIAASEEMPADKFAYKPTPEQMTFGHLAAHIVVGNYFFCSNLGHVPRPKIEEPKETEGKHNLVAPLKA